MNLDILNILLNLLISVLLVATISYCFVLNKRIKILQDGKSELANLLKYFDESTVRASESIVALQTASKKIGENIQMRIDKVNYLMEDLSFLIEKGNRLANQLDANFAVNRAKSRVMSEEDTYESAHIEREEAIFPERNITAFEPPVLVKTPEKPTNKEKTSASLEAVLDRITGRGKPANQNSDITTNEKQAASRQKSSARSKAEQELLDMIRSGVKG